VKSDEFFKLYEDLPPESRLTAEQFLRFLHEQAKNGRLLQMVDGAKTDEQVGAKSGDELREEDSFLQPTAGDDLTESNSAENLQTETLKLTAIFPTTPSRVYQAWLDSQEHAWFTGGAAEIDPQVGGTFMVWDGYIQGRTTDLEVNTHIRQTWRTTDFPEDSPDSMIDLTLEAVPEGVLLKLVHTRIPEGQRDEYEKVWREYYFAPMHEYFSR
jgi:activator of HSP90 ATPase